MSLLTILPVFTILKNGKCIRKIPKCVSDVQNEYFYRRKIIFQTTVCCTHSVLPQSVCYRFQMELKLQFMKWDCSIFDKFPSFSIFIALPSSPSQLINMVIRLSLILDILTLKTLKLKWKCALYFVFSVNYMKNTNNLLNV